MATNADVISAQMERVKPKLQTWIETSNSLAAILRKSASSDKVSAFNTTDAFGTPGISAFRIPVEIYDGGDYRAVSLDEGDFGAGSSMKTQYMTIGYFATDLVVQLSQLEMDATATSEQAVVNVFSKSLSRMVTQMQAYDDAGSFGDGTGVLATGSGVGSPAGSNPTYALEPNFGPQRLRVNQPVGVYDTTLVTKKNAATVRVASIDPAGKSVTLTGTVTSPVNTDKLVFDGLTGTLTTGSYRLGLYTFQNSATSGSTLGLNRATYNEVVTPNVNAAGPLVPAHGQLLWDTIIQRRDEEAYKGLMGILHQTQKAAIKLQGIAISDWMRGPKDDMIDILPGDNADLSVKFAGIMHKVCKKNDRSRIDWFNPKNFGYAKLHDIKFHEVEGRKIFEQRSSTGTVKAGCYVIMKQADNLYSADPGAAGLISGLTLPQGY